jgi:hypothetical protein
LRGFGLGFTAKCCGNTFLLLNANYLAGFTGWMKQQTGRDK